MSIITFFPLLLALAAFALRFWLGRGASKLVMLEAVPAPVAQVEVAAARRTRVAAPVQSGGNGFAAA